MTCLTGYTNPETEYLSISVDEIVNVATKRTCVVQIPRGVWEENIWKINNNLLLKYERVMVVRSGNLQPTRVENNITATSIKELRTKYKADPPSCILVVRTDSLYHQWGPALLQFLIQASAETHIVFHISGCFSQSSLKDFLCKEMLSFPLIGLKHLIPKCVVNVTAVEKVEPIYDKKSQVLNELMNCITNWTHLGQYSKAFTAGTTVSSKAEENAAIRQIMKAAKYELLTFGSGRLVAEEVMRITNALDSKEWTVPDISAVVAAAIGRLNVLLKNNKNLNKIALYVPQQHQRCLTHSTLGSYMSSVIESQFVLSHLGRECSSGIPNVFLCSSMDSLEAISPYDVIFSIAHEVSLAPCTNNIIHVMQYLSPDGRLEFVHPQLPEDRDFLIPVRSIQRMQSLWCVQWFL